MYGLFAAAVSMCNILPCRGGVSPRFAAAELCVIPARAATAVTDDESQEAKATRRKRWR